MSRTDGWAFCRSCGAVDVPAPRAAPERVPVRAAASRPAVRTAVEPAAGGAVQPARVRVPLHDTPHAGVPRGPASVARPSVRLEAAQLGSGAAWAGAALAALVVLVVLALPGAVLAVALGADAAGGSPWLLLPVSVALGVGGSVGVTVGSTGLGVTAAATPLLVTGLAVAAGAALVVAPTRHAPEVPRQAARALVLFLAGLATVALLGRAAAPDATLTVAVAPTLLGGLVWFGGALAVAVAWRRPDALPAAGRRARDRLAGPVAGLGAVLGCCWLGGLALVVAAVLAHSGSGAVPELPGLPGTASGAPPVAAVLLVVVFAPSALLVAFAVCLGVPLTPRTPGGDGEVALVHLLAAGPSWWLAPLVAGVVCTLGGTVAALHAPAPDAPVRRGWALGPALAALLAAAVPATSLVVGPFGLHLDLTLGVVLGLAWGTAGGLLGAVIAPGLPSALRAGRPGPPATTTGRVVGLAVVLLVLAAALAVGVVTAARVG